VSGAAISTDPSEILKSGTGHGDRTGPGRVYLATEDLAVGYDGRPALSGVRFEVRPGTKVGVLGPNGGGKTTLFRAVLGQIRPLSGSLKVGATAATVPQTDRTRLDYPVTALDVALMGALSRLPWWRRPGRRDREIARTALATVGLAGVEGESFGALSGGQRQRVLIARALTSDAELLLLDEPYTGLDSASSNRLGRVIDDLARAGRSVMIATHDVEQAREWDRVLCLNRRQIAFGPPDDTLDRRVLETTYGGSIVEIPGHPGEGVLPPHHHDHERA